MIALDIRDSLFDIRYLLSLRFTWLTELAASALSFPSQQLGRASSATALDSSAPGTRSRHNLALQFAPRWKPIEIPRLPEESDRRRAPTRAARLPNRIIAQRPSSPGRGGQNPPVCLARCSSGRHPSSFLP